MIDRKVNSVGKSLVTRSGFALHNTRRHKLFPVSIASMKDTMPSLLSLRHSRRAFIAAPVLLLLIWLLVGTPHVRAQKRKPSASSTQATQNANTSSAAQQKTLRKKLTAPRSSDSSEGSRVTIASDGVLNDYSAYRSGNRFYVVIPQADAPQTAGSVRGRGFNNVQVQKRGGDAVISFQLQPGTAARVNQKFNKLDVVFSASSVQPSVSTGNPKPTQKPISNPRVNETKLGNPSAMPQSNTRTVPAETKQPIISGTRLNPAANANISAEPTKQQRQSNNTALLPPLNSGLPVQSQSPISNAANANASPAAAASPAGEIAQQTQPAPIAPVNTGAGDTTAANSTTSSNSTGSLGAVVARNWPLALIAALVLGVLGVAFAMRASKGSQPDTAAQHAAIRQGILDAPDKQIPPLPESTFTRTDAATNFAPTISAAPIAAATMATVAAAEPVPEREALPVFADKATREVEVVAPAVDVERAEIETQNVLAGEPYDETIISTKDSGARQIIAAGFLAALAGRNLQKRDNARAAFIKHDYFDEAVRDLRDAEAPAERTSAARALGLVRDTAATPHLVAALEDASPEVRRAAVEALAEVRDPQAVAPLEALRDREKNRKEKTRKIPRALIQRAIEASIIGQEKIEAPTRVTPIPLAPHVVEEATAAPFASVDETPTIEAAPVIADDLTLASSEASLAPSVETASGVAEDTASQYTEAPVPHEVEVIHAPDTVETFSPTVVAETDNSTIETAPPVVLDHSFIEVADDSARASTLQATPPVIAEESPAKIFESNLADEAITGTQFAPPLSPQQEIVESSVTTSETSPSSAYSPDPLIERHNAPAQGWVEVDMSEPEVVSHATPVNSSAVDASAAPEAFTAAPFVEGATPRATSSFETVAPISPEVIEETLPPVSAGQTEREIDVAVADKSIEPFGDDLSTVPSAILKRLASEDANERASAVEDLARVSGEDSFREISASFDDPAQEVRNAAAHALFNLSADRAASFTRALREAPPERRRKIGSALATSGLANDAIGHLMGESREKTYDAFSLLFLMSKAGEVQPLMKAIEEYPNNEVRLAVVKLLALSGQQEILPAFRRLAVRGSLPTEVRSAVMEAIYQISSQTSSDAPSAV